MIDNIKQFYEKNIQSIHFGDKILNPKVKKVLTDLKRKYEALSIRERMFVCIFVLAALYFLWDMTFNHFFKSSEEEYLKSKAALHTTVSELQGRLMAAEKSVGTDNREVLVKQSEQLKTKIQMLDTQIAKQVKQLVSTKEMHSMIQDIVNNTSGVEIVVIETLPIKEELVGGGQGATVTPEKKPLKLFTHSLRLEFIATYSQLLALVDSLEKKKMKLFWDELKFEVENYPRIKNSITVHTIGLEEGWFDA